MIRNKVLVRLGVLFAVAIYFILSSTFLFSINSVALTYQSSVGVGFTFNPTIAVTLSGDLLINNLAPSSASDSNIIDVTVATNASQGYSLLATVGTKDSNSALINTSNSNYIFTSLATTAGSAPSLSNFSDNTWGYSYSIDNGTNWISGNAGSTASGYAGLPLDNNDGPEERGNGGITLIDTHNPADGKTIKFKIGAKASSSQASGIYTNIINFYAVANPEQQLGPVTCDAGKICYNANALTPVQGEMGKQSAGNNASVQLWAPNFKRDDYGFAGWNTAYDYSGTNYGPNQTITTPTDTSTNGLSLYAIWIRTTGDMQNWSGCSSLTQGAVTALKDSRDNSVYTVAKLADGKCWMIENLRLDNTPELSSANTHNPSLPLTNNNSATSNHLSATTDPTNTAWCTTNSSNCIDQSILSTNNTTLFTNNTASNYDVTSNVYSYGNYYNWYSATVGHGKYGESYGSSYIASGDICPTGWHLPTGKDATGEFGALDIALGGNGVYSNSDTTPTGTVMSLRYRTYPNNFVYPGFINGSSFYNRGSYGVYWSASGANSYYAYYVYFNNTNVNSDAYDGNKHDGLMVRCISSN